MTEDDARLMIQNYMLKFAAMKKVLTKMEAVQRLQNFLRYSNTIYRIERMKKSVKKIEKFWIKVKQNRSIKKELSDKLLEIQQKRIIEQEKLKKAKEKLHKDALLDLRRRNFVFAKKFFVSPTKKEELDLSENSTPVKTTVYAIMESKVKKRLFKEQEKEEKKVESPKKDQQTQKIVTNKKTTHPAVEQKELTPEEKEVRTFELILEII